jgi:hypothetical protein
MKLAQAYHASTLSPTAPVRPRPPLRATEARPSKAPRLPQTNRWLPGNGDLRYPVNRGACLWAAQTRKRKTLRVRLPAASVAITVMRWRPALSLPARTLTLKDALVVRPMRLPSR